MGKKETGRARGRQAGANGGLLGRKPKAEREKKSLFFFLFKYFKVFSNYFESSFEFESNHSIQKFKCNSMNAQICSYPYI
jgi:hypothetical protein